MPGQPPDASHAGNAHQAPTAPLHHGRDERLKGGCRAHRVGRQNLGHGGDVFAQRGVHAHADACVGYHYVGHALALQAVLPRGGNAVWLRHICAINFIATGAYSVCLSP